MLDSLSQGRRVKAVAVRALVHQEYVAVIFAGEVTPESVARLAEREPAALAALRSHGRLLFDFSAVTRFGFDPLSLGEAMQRQAGQGLRLAICSSNPEFFGVGRQIAQYSGVEGNAINVFRAEPEAVAWLTGRDAPTHDA